MTAVLCCAMVLIASNCRARCRSSEYKRAFCKRNRGLRGKQSQQLDGFMVEVIEAIALAVEHAHDFVAHHERNRQLRARGLRGADVARVLAHVGA